MNQLFFYIAGVVFVVEIGLWTFYYLMAQKVRPLIRSANNPSVAVLIACRNDYDILLENLPSICDQDYSNYEVIVVDDHSTEVGNKTLDVLRQMPATFIENGLEQGKKYALSYAIQGLSHELILQTDADCRPASRHWISGMVNALGAKDIVIGYGGYEKKPGFLNQLIRFETIRSSIQYFAWTIFGLPYMAVGRNLLYRRSLVHHYILPEKMMSMVSGDDDLFINTRANADNTAVCLDPDTYTYSRPGRTWASYLRQKKRHISTSTSYRTRNQIVLGIQQSSYMLFHSAIIWLVLSGSFWVVSLFILRLLVAGIVFRFWRKKLEENTVGNYILLDWMLFLTYIYLTPWLIIKRNEW